VENRFFEASRAPRPLGRRARGALIAMLVSPLMACASAPLTTFDLSPVDFASGRVSGRGQLVIAEPVATSPADSDRIVVRPTPESIATLKGAQWTENLPRLVQTRLLQSFENAHSLKTVGRSGGAMDADFTLATEIRRFEIDVAAGEAIVELSAKIVSNRAGRVVASRIFSARAPGSAIDGGVAASALDAALGQAMREIVPWTAGHV
jgi:cholesterol transport system auxiliary component